MLAPKKKEKYSIQPFYVPIYEGFSYKESCTQPKGFDPNTSTLVPGDPSLPLRRCHGRGFPLVRDSEAVYSSKALWRSRLAVIIQLIGYEPSSPVTPLLAPWNEGIRTWEEYLDISHTGSRSLPGEAEKGQY